MENEEDLESLGEKLYQLIYPKYADMASKLTGMLLELPGAVISQMLQDEALLTKALERAMEAVHSDPRFYSKPPPQADDIDSVSSDSMGEQLYELINLYNTEYTQKITGMLLEQDKKVVLLMLSDPVLLQEKVNLALKTLQGSSCHSQRETVMKDGADQNEVEVIGEKLFALVQDIDPVHCADITGMLLEIDVGTLKKILSDRGMLEVAVQRAKSARENAPSQEWTRMDNLKTTA